MMESVCVKAREIEREREGERDRKRESVCVYLCGRVRERENTQVGRETEVESLFECVSARVRRERASKREKIVGARGT